MKYIKFILLFAVLISLNTKSFAEKDCSIYNTNTVMGNYNKRKCEKGIKATKKMSFKEKLKLLNPLQKKKND